MGDVAQLNIEQENLRRIRARLLQWDAKENPLAPLTSQQIDSVDIITEKWKEVFENPQKSLEVESSKDDTSKPISTTCESLKDLQENSTEIEKTTDFLSHFSQVHEEIYGHSDGVYQKYLQQLKVRSGECDEILEEIDTAIEKLGNLQEEYDFVSNKTSALNSASEKLTEEQGILHEMSEEIQKRLHFFNQVETLTQRLQSPTMSVSSDAFKDCLNRIDECLEYLKANPKFKESGIYIVKYRNHCLSKALSLIRTYVTNVLSQATSQILSPTKPQAEASLSSNANSDAAFALYYGKFQTSAIKIKRVSMMVEERIGKCPEYDQLISDIHHNYLSERASIMSPAVDKAFKDLVKASKANSKGDYCTLMRSACSFLAHVCQDEHRLFYQFFTIQSDQLNTYLDGLCTLLYDTIRPYIIHINHLETLAEICCILRIEMIEEHVQQNPEQLEAFGKIANQLLQDVQERLVFRAYLYLQSDILNYNPSPGDLAYPQKLEMMESIALSLQEQPTLKRSDSRSSMISSASSVFQDNESVIDARSRTLNSPADLHGMWYPTVRRTLVCLSRLYRCVDRPIFQGLSQEALKYCIESVSKASAKISAARTPIDGELFEIKHLLILREQIAPFRVDFTVKETSLDFSKVKTAAFGLLQKRKQLFSMGSNNALLEFLLDGTPQVKEQLLDSRKEVDRQLKSVCELFIKNSVQMFVGPILQFLEKAQSIVSVEQSPQPQQKVNYALRQSPWASPQQISVIVQESQRLIKSKLSGLQRSMQLYLSNRDTEFIIFKPIRNNIIGAFSKLEQILTSNGYTNDDMIMTSCPSAEQVSILLSSASILATENARKISTSSIESVPAYTRKISQTEKKVSFDSPAITEEQLVVEEGDSKVLEESSSQDAILEVKEESSQVTNEADEPKVLKDEVDNNVGTPTV